MNWDWKSLLRSVLPVVLSWLLGTLGVGVPQLTPQRIVNTPMVTK